MIRKIPQNMGFLNTPLKTLTVGQEYKKGDEHVSIKDNNIIWLAVQTTPKYDVRNTYQTQQNSHSPFKFLELISLNSVIHTKVLKIRV